jgi:hypothetical protein
MAAGSVAITGFGSRATRTAGDQLGDCGDVAADTDSR